MFSCWLMIEMVRVPPVFTPVTAALISMPAFFCTQTTLHSEMLALMVVEWKKA